MKVNKLGWFLIGIVIIALAWAVLALQFKDTIGAGTNYLFVELLGANLVRGITGASMGIMTWGSQSFTQATAVILGTGIGFIVLGMIASRLIWPRIHSEKKTPAQTLPVTPLQDSLQKPALPPVTKEEVAS